MPPYWIGIAAGLVIGTILGFTLCALLVTAKRADRQMKEGGPMEHEKYYMIHNPGNQQPSKMHAKWKDVADEAQRLGEKHPGQVFIILEAVSGCIVSAPVEWINIKDES